MFSLIDNMPLPPTPHVHGNLKACSMSAKINTTLVFCFFLGRFDAFFVTLPISHSGK